MWSFVVVIGDGLGDGSFKTDESSILQHFLFDRSVLSFYSFFLPVRFRRGRRFQSTTTQFL